LLARSGYARFLAREASDRGFLRAAQGTTWVLTDAAVASDDYCFAHTVLIAPQEISAESVNASAKGILDYFLETCRDEKFTQAWPRHFHADDTVTGLTRRASAVERAFKEALSKRLARVAKLAQPQAENILGPTRGLFVYWRDFTNCWAARDAVLGGQRRMADDPAAPSRSYLKLEEAYGILGREPQPGETVVDLGAAPGGWSFSAAKHGASVLALDNGPLKGGALGHPLIRHEEVDAFRYAPTQGKPFDWLLCDVVDDPDKVLGLLERWVAQRWCRRFVVNFKFGRTDPLPLLRKTIAANAPLAKACFPLRARHLFHDREEFTLVGELRE
jgi:23S rRNA (cytidine2498-2'-O)-methyltransferase